MKINKQTDKYMLGNEEEDRRYFSHCKKRFELILSEIDKIVRSKKNITILDIGTSPLTFLIRDRYPKIKLTTLDYSDNFKNACTRRGISFIKQDLNKKKNKLAKKSYDVILFLEVLEHIKGDHSLVLQNIIDALKENGYLIIQTPNKYSLKSLALNVITKKFWDKMTYVPVHSDEFNHFKEYEFLELKNLLLGMKGVKLIHASRPLYFDHPESTLVYRKNKLFFYPIMLVYYWIVYFIPFFRRGMHFKLQKNSDSFIKQTYYRTEGWVPKSVTKGAVRDILTLIKPMLKKPLNQVKVLDVGMGFGEYSVEISKYVNKVTGVEPYKQAYDYAVKHNKKKNIKFYNSKIEDFDTKERFDLVLSLTTLEHMPDADASFKNTFRLMSKGGLIYLTAPNKLWPYDNHYLLPFLTWLPLNLANFYVKVTGRGVSYEDSYYSKTYWGVKKLLNQFPCKYQFILPDPNSEYLGCGVYSGLEQKIAKLGIWLISKFEFMWIFSKGFLILVQKN